jgi:predicted 2-oxoglutarate/Fe(II)-dependent dioxygenase YbiX
LKLLGYQLAIFEPLDNLVNIALLPIDPITPCLGNHRRSDKVEKYVDEYVPDIHPNSRHGRFVTSLSSASFNDSLDSFAPHFLELLEYILRGCFTASEEQGK